MSLIRERGTGKVLAMNNAELFTGRISSVNGANLDLPGLLRKDKRNLVSSPSSNGRTDLSADPALKRRVTSKTGRGHGKKKKTNVGTGFKLENTFRAHSHDIQIAYIGFNHREKPDLG